jgi:3-deoxy-7-phosphoheptulonate synthase
VNNLSCFYLSNLYFLTRTLLAAQTILQGRLATENILKGNDDKLLVVVG